MVNVTWSSIIIFIHIYYGHIAEVAMVNVTWSSIIIYISDI